MQVMRVDFKNGHSFSRAIYTWAARPMPTTKARLIRERKDGDESWAADVAMTY